VSWVRPELGRILSTPVGRWTVNRPVGIVGIAPQPFPRPAGAVEIDHVTVLFSVAPIRPGRRDLRRVTQPLIFEGLQPAKAIADDEPAVARPRIIAPGGVQGRSQKQQDRSGRHFDGDRRFKIGYAGMMAARPDAGSAVLRSEFRQRPHDIHQILDLALVALPHILVAVRKLRWRAEMNLDALAQLEIKTIAPGAEHFFARSPT
jgi:hypothetical protein